MWHIQDAQFVQPLGMPDSKCPGHDRTPIVPDQIHFFVTKRIHQAEDVIHEFVDGIRFYPFGLVAQVVSTLVRDDDAVSRFSQRFNLRPPSVPVLREVRVQISLSNLLCYGNYCFRGEETWSIALNSSSFNSHVSTSALLKAWVAVVVPGIGMICSSLRKSQFNMT